MMTNITYRSNAGSTARRLLETSALTLVFSAGLLAAGMGAARADSIDNGYGSSHPINIIYPQMGEGRSAGISGNGKVVVGQIVTNDLAAPHAFTWGINDEWTFLDGLPIVSFVSTVSYTTALAVNYDGSVIVGTSSEGGGRQHAVRWTNGTPEELTGVTDAVNTVATGLSRTGSVIVGYSEFDSSPSTSQGIRWEGTDMRTLAGLNGSEMSKAFGVSGDGSVIVGEAQDGNNPGNRYAVRWTDQGTEVHDLGSLLSGNGVWSTASAVSSNGSVIVGSFGQDSGTTHAFRWTAQGTADIDNRGSEAYSVANAVSGDGSVIVGQLRQGAADRAFRWANGQMQTVEDWLEDNGVELGGSDFTTTATGVSEDGKVIVGDAENGHMFIARAITSGDTDTPGTTSGIIDVQQYNTTLVAKPSAQVGLGYANTVLQGAHGEPMRDLLGLGQRSVAFTSDIGYDDSRVSNGGVGIGDVTFGYGLAEGVTARFAGGGLYTKQDIETGGDFHQAAFYMSPEATIALGSSNVYATIGGYYSTGRMNIHRGYMNGAAMDFSHGETDVDTYGAKIRFDWLNAATIAGTKLTPYASLTYAHSHMDGYTEEGGSFPSAFDSVNDHSTVARIGVDFIHDVTDTVRLTARAEADYRFEKTTAGTSGQIVGLSAFEFDGEDVKQLWLRGAIGTEFDVAGGTASLGINVTTEGDDPNVWLRSGWNVKF